MLGWQGKLSICIVIQFQGAVKPAAEVQKKTGFLFSLQENWGVNRNKHWETPKPQWQGRGRIISTDIKLNTEPASFLPAANHRHESRQIKRTPNGRPSQTNQPPFSWVDECFI